MTNVAFISQKKKEICNVSPLRNIDFSTENHALFTSRISCRAWRDKRNGHFNHHSIQFITNSLTRHSTTCRKRLTKVLLRLWQWLNKSSWNSTSEENRSRWRVLLLLPCIGQCSSSYAISKSFWTKQWAITRLAVDLTCETRNGFNRLVSLSYHYINMGAIDTDKVLWKQLRYICVRPWFERQPQYIPPVWV